MVLLIRRSRYFAATAAAILPLLAHGCGGSDSPPPQEHPLVAEMSPASTRTATAAVANPTETPTEAPADSTATPTRCNTDSAQAPTPSPQVPPLLKFNGCEEVATETHYCIATTESEIQLLGLDSGTLCPIAATTAPLGGALPPLNSIAWSDDHLYVCGSEGLTDISLRDGSSTLAPALCNGVATYEDGLLLNQSFVNLVLMNFLAPNSIWYPSFAAVASGPPQRTFDLGDLAATISVSEQTLYSAWHAGVSVNVGDLATDQALGVLTLEDYDGWILSLSATDDGYLAVSGDPWGASVYLFDAYDGRMVERFDFATAIRGLACVTGENAPLHATPTPTPTPNVRASATATPTACEDSFACATLCDFEEPRPFSLDELPPSLGVPSCRGSEPASNYTVREDLLDPEAGEELHVIGVYEGAGDPGFRPYPQGVVDVTIHARPLPVALALSSYQAMRWRIALDRGAQLSRVIVQGYGPQTVDGIPEDVPVVERNAEEACGRAYEWEASRNDDSDGYASMLASLRHFTGLTETSFQGCYTGSHFEIPYWSGDPPTEQVPLLSTDEQIAISDDSAASPATGDVSRERRAPGSTLDGRRP